MEATAMTIEVSSANPHDSVRQKTAKLLRYPTLEECRMAEGRDEPQVFEWQFTGQDEVRTYLHVDVVGGDGIQTFVHGRTGPRGARYAMKCVATYNGDIPVAFGYLR